MRAMLPTGRSCAGNRCTSLASMPGSYIVAGARTPIGKMSGALASLSAADLGGAAIAAALERAGVAPDEVDHVIMGQVLMAGQGQVPSRQAAVKAGIPMSVPSVNVNKVCLSGLNAIYLADQMIAAGEADIVVAGGMESMTNAPYLADGARGGFRYGNTELRDAIIADGLWCAFDACLMGLGTERYAAGTISREAQDELAAASHERAANAIKDGRFADEIVPGVDPPAQGRPDRRRARRGRPPRHDGREPRRPAPGVRQGRHGHRRQRQPAQRRRQRRRADVEGGGRGAAASQPLGEFVSYGMVAGPDSASLLQQPSRAIRKALAARRPRARRLDLFEINEAFAAVGLASMADLGISTDVVNVNGGAIALGHPIGMSGNRLALTLLHELRRRGGGTGAAALCGGGGQGDALIVRTRLSRNEVVPTIWLRVRHVSDVAAVSASSSLSPDNCGRTDLSMRQGALDLFKLLVL